MSYIFIILDHENRENTIICERNKIFGMKLEKSNKNRQKQTLLR